MSCRQQSAWCGVLIGTGALVYHGYPGSIRATCRYLCRKESHDGQGDASEWHMFKEGSLSSTSDLTDLVPGRAVVLPRLLCLHRGPQPFLTIEDPARSIA
jgi:hypothetical protein